MGREDYYTLAQVARRVYCNWREPRRYLHSMLSVFLVHAWAAAHGQSVSWACRRGNWDARSCPRSLADQTTMSRRLREDEFEHFRQAVAEEISRGISPAPEDDLVLCLDGSPLEIAPHSGDKDAAFGQTYGKRTGRGYRLHALWSPGGLMPLAWAVYPMDVDERTVAREFLVEAFVVRAGLGPGYLLADSKYDTSELYDLAWACGRQLLAPRPRPLTGLGHHYQSPQRLRGIEMLEMPVWMKRPQAFGPALFRWRKSVERKFSNLCSRAGLLTHLPTWARRLHRVRQWVGTMLLLNAAREIFNASRKGDA